MELRYLVDLMKNDNVFNAIVNNPMAQFGPTSRTYLGATILPERQVRHNVFKETAIKYRSIIANAGTRYSPPSIKGNAIIGSQVVELAESDAASEFSAEAYDALMEIIIDLPNVTNLSEVPPAAMAELIRWADMTLNVPLLEFNEFVRWQALVNSTVTMLGDNGFREIVAYYNPDGHRVSAAGDWTDDDYDPYPDIVAGYAKLVSKEYRPTRMITSLEVLNVLLGNKQIRMRLGLLSLQNNTLVGLPGNASRDALNARLAQDQLPPIETYDLQYRKSVGTEFFLPRQTLVMLGATGQDVQVDRGDQQHLFMSDTLGYTAIGRPANRPSPGRATRINYNDGKGAPVTGEAWQTSLPVIDNPEAIYVIKEIDVTPTP